SVATLVRVTDALGTTAPVGSLIVPWMFPVPAICPESSVAAHHKSIGNRDRIPVAVNREFCIAPPNRCVLQRGVHSEISGRTTSVEARILTNPQENCQEALKWTTPVLWELVSHHSGQNKLTPAVGHEALVRQVQSPD